MTMPQQPRITCAPRPQSPNLETQDTFVGRVSTQALSPMASFWGEESLPQNAGPLYVEKLGDQYCAYPIQTNQFLLHSPFADDSIFPESARLLPNYFGKPTLLRQNRDTNSADMIYDPETQRYYAPDVAGLRWYLVGDETNALSFWEAVDHFTLQLQENAGKALLFPGTDETGWNFSAGGNPPNVWNTLSWSKSFGPFLAWLKKSDPELYTQAYGVLKIAFRAPHDPCDSAYLADAYAYYNPQEDKIHLMPRSLEQLENGNFAAVAQTLVHEVKHRDNFLRGLTSPTDEIATRSINFYLDAFGRRHLGSVVHFSALREHLFDKLYCSNLPLLPEEEFSAFAEEFHYAEGPHGIAHQAFAAPRREALDMTEGLSQVLFESLPVTWSFLAIQYVHLANSNQASHPNQTMIRNLFLEDVRERLNCAMRGETCNDPTAARMSLEAILSSGGQ